MTGGPLYRPLGRLEAGGPPGLVAQGLSVWDEASPASAPWTPFSLGQWAGLSWAPEVGVRRG